MITIVADARNGRESGWAAGTLAALFESEGKPCRVWCPWPGQPAGHLNPPGFRRQPRRLMPREAVACVLVDPRLAGRPGPRWAYAAGVRGRHWWGDHGHVLFPGRAPVAAAHSTVGRAAVSLWHPGDVPRRTPAPPGSPPRVLVWLDRPAADDCRGHVGRLACSLARHAQVTVLHPASLAAEDRCDLREAEAAGVVALRRAGDLASAAAAVCHADLAVVPGVCRGLGLPLALCMAAKVPVAAFDCSPYDEYVGAYAGGLTVPLTAGLSGLCAAAVTQLASGGTPWAKLTPEEEELWREGFKLFWLHVAFEDTTK